MMKPLLPAQRPPVILFMFNSKGQTMYIHTYQTRPDGTRDTFQTILVESKIDPLPWQELGLCYTASGYGSRIPTRHKVKFNGRWRRVYCRIYSNVGTLYIGRLSDNLIVGE